MQLNQQSLSQIGTKIHVPRYERSAVKMGIVHVGVGGFHRAHLGVIVQRLLEAEGNDQWGICGIGLREGDRKISEVFAKQDCLYTLITRHPTGKIEAEVMGQMMDFLLASDDKQAVINRMAHPETKIVSLTITEGGYNLRSDGEFDIENPDVQYELENPNDPKTIYGYLFAALKKRRNSGDVPFTVMSCDNIQHNGDVMKKMMLSFANAQDPEFAHWIEKEVAFPNSMVDRITPVTTIAEIDYLKNQYEVDDEWPVTCEPFLQWVIEDKFSDECPDFDRVDGVQFVADVSPYEKMKIRLLNAGHSVLGIPGAVYGHPTINACMEDSVFAKFMREFMDVEATPMLDAVDGIDLEKYKNTLEERFSNPNIKDNVSRICSESSAKLPKFLIPTIMENLECGGSIALGSFVLATWCFYHDREMNQKGQSLEIIDALKPTLHKAASGTSKNPIRFLELDEVFGDLKKDSRFTEKFAKWVKKIYEVDDIRALMQEVLGAKA